MRYGYLFTALLCVSLCGGCGQRDASASPDTFGERVDLRYAEQFTMERDDAGRVLVTIAGAERFLLVPDGVTAPDSSATTPDSHGDGVATPDSIDNGDSPGTGVTVLHTPLQSVYVAASSAMDFFRRLDALDAVRFTSTSAQNWSLAPVRAAVERGQIRYAGKYSAPDFEALLAAHCPLAVESTMIFHSPDIREQLEALGVPVLVERSSYEPHPLGRMEWIKLYGLLTGREAEADAFFAQQAQAVEQILSEADTGKSVAFFSVSPNGYVNVRKPGDYVTKMLEMAGGHYVFSGLLPETDSAVSTMNLQMEAFYAGAKDADILIYNGAIDGGMETLSQLLGKSELLADFKAVKAGNVWCTERNMFQETTAVGGIVADLRTVFAGGDAPLTYLHRLSGTAPPGA